MSFRPIPRFRAYLGASTHRLALSWGDTFVTVQRLSHALPASSTPHQSVPGHLSPASFILELWGLLGPETCIFLYDRDHPALSASGKTIGFGAAVPRPARSHAYASPSPSLGSAPGLLPARAGSPLAGQVSHLLDD